MNNFIQLSGLTKHYLMGEEMIFALREVSLTVERDEFVVLQGPSGSGKSTLLNICGLIDAPDTGIYTWEGVEVWHQTPRERTVRRRDDIGFIFQTFNLFQALTVFENVEYPLLLTGIPRRQRMPLVMALLERIGLVDRRQHLPRQLSGGERQRVGIARALVKKPKLVIADEPTANLDAHAAIRVVELMKSLALETQTTLLVATHDDRVVAHGDRIIQLRDGCLT